MRAGGQRGRGVVGAGAFNGSHRGERGLGEAGGGEIFVARRLLDLPEGIAAVGGEAV